MGSSPRCPPSPQAPRPKPGEVDSMSENVSTERVGFGIAVLGGPTTVVDIAGLRLVADPTFDPPADKGYLTKIGGPAVSEAGLGPVDACWSATTCTRQSRRPWAGLRARRAVARQRPRRPPLDLGPTATPLPAMGDVSVPRGDRPGVSHRAVPAMHGPGGRRPRRDGNVNCEVTGFVLSGPGRSHGLYQRRQRLDRASWPRWPAASARSTWPCCSSERHACRARSAAAR